MKIQAARSLIASFLVSAIVLLAAVAGAQSENSSARTSCPSLEQSDAPQLSISNGLINAVIYPPDPKDGYYRSTRFDWAGVIGCLAYKGHTYFGAWSPNHNPLVADSIAGPVEEFRSADGSLGYADAKSGGLFVKPGVGVLRKIDDNPYKYMFFYPVIDTGKWTVHAKRSGISFTQSLQSSVGYSYQYTKTLELLKNQPILVIHHSMKNTGSKTIDTDVYEHDFFMLDKAPTGPDMVVHFAFEPKAALPLQHGGEIIGKDLVYHQELQPKESVTSFLTGFSNGPSDYDFTLEDRKTGVGVEQTGDSPMSNFNFWSVRSTIAPEAYVHLHILPGQTQSYTIRYRFFTK
jgi:hypothetical protein